MINEFRENSYRAQIPKHQVRVYYYTSTSPNPRHYAVYTKNKFLVRRKKKLPSNSHPEADIKRHSLFVRQIGKRMSVPFPLDIRITPSMKCLCLRQLLLALFVQTDVDPTEGVRHEELHDQEYHDCSLTRDICRGVLRLKNLRADDVAQTEGRHCQRIYRNLLTR